MMKCIVILFLAVFSMTVAAVSPVFGEEPILFSNNFSLKARTPKLDAEKIVVFDPVEEWTYCHHPSLAFFKGRFYAVFSNSPKGEDECGQRILLTTSDDFVEWGTPAVLLAPEEGE